VNGQKTVTSKHSRAAFTLIELLVSLGIIAVLISLLIPAVQRVRELASRARCTNNLHQIGLALQQYHDSSRVLPPGCWNIPNDYLFLSWEARILPWTEQDALWKNTQAAFTQQGLFSLRARG
jgi:prepilin-type N-terminal cleavage/methylation domain-containing protein